MSEGLVPGGTSMEVDMLPMLVSPFVYLAW